MFQYSEDEVLGEALTRLMPKHLIEPHIASMNYVVGGGEPRFIGRAVEVMAIRKDQTEFPIELVLSTWEEDNELFFTGIIRDITERKVFEEQLKYQNAHDILTGLFNRQYYETEIERLQDSRRFPISIIVMDVDGLKKINDTLGHSTGDEHLRQLAGLLKRCFRPEDLIARIGGDEFVAVLPETGFSSATNIVNRLRDNLQEINEKKNDLHRIELSIGLATCEHQNESLSYVFKQADRAMYEEKNTKKM
jgi:diguanylate cyclase (GGDEF)-like protein/PAS domain S-box-containing protein